MVTRTAARTHPNALLDAHALDPHAHIAPRSRRCTSGPTNCTYCRFHGRTQYLHMRPDVFSHALHTSSLRCSGIPSSLRAPPRWRVPPSVSGTAAKKNTYCFLICADLSVRHILSRPRNAHSMEGSLEAPPPTPATPCAPVDPSPHRSSDPSLDAADGASVPTTPQNPARLFATPSD